MSSERCDVCGDGIMSHAMGGHSHEYVNAEEAAADVEYARRTAHAETRAKVLLALREHFPVVATDKGDCVDYYACSCGALRSPFNGALREKWFEHFASVIGEERRDVKEMILETEP